MRFIVYFLVITSLFVRCTETEGNPKVTADSKKTNTDTTILQDKKVHALDMLTFDWFELKQSVRFLNCGARITSEKNKLSQAVPPAFLYEYCAHNGNQPKEQRLPGIDPGAKLIEAIVLKTDEIGQYDDLNEELLFLHVSASYKQLGALNLVNQTKKEIITNFGPPELDSLNNLVYISKPKVLVFHYNDQLKISAFKYYLRFNPDMNPPGELQNLQW